MGKRRTLSCRPSASPTSRGDLQGVWLVLFQEADEHVGPLDGDDPIQVLPEVSLPASGAVNRSGVFSRREGHADAARPETGEPVD